MVGEDNRVYLGKPENCYLSPDGEAPAYYDQLGPLPAADLGQHQDIPFPIQPGPAAVPAADAPGALFHQADYIEFASLREGVLSHYPLIREVTFAGKPFVPPKAYQRNAPAPPAQPPVPLKPASN